MSNLLRKARQIPWWGWALGLFYFALQYGMYRFGNFISVVTGAINNAWCPKLACIDDKIPVISVFILIYVFSYVFWICAPAVVCLTSKKNRINYFIGLTLAYLVGFVIFAFAPTYMDRIAEGIYSVGEKGGIFNQLLMFIYNSDGSDIAFNLFPSYHCLISLYCYLGIRKQPEISKGFKIYSIVMTVLICLSTLFTKQHYILDCISGLSISLISYLIVEKINPSRWIINKSNKR